MVGGIGTVIKLYEFSVSEYPAAFLEYIFMLYLVLDDKFEILYVELMSKSVYSSPFNLYEYFVRGVYPLLSEVSLKLISNLALFMVGVI